MIGRRGFLRMSAIGMSAFGAGRIFAQDPPSPTPKTKTKTTSKTPPKAAKSKLEASETVNRLLAPIRDEHHLPGLIGAVVTGNTLAMIGAVGIRKIGSTEAFRVDDTVHLGSDTKAMTATLCGMLVEEAKLNWSTTIGDLFRDKVSGLAEDVASITLLQLLTHRAGLPHDPDNGWWGLPGDTPTEQRRSLLDGVLKTALLSKPGEKHEYSNLGYVLAGLMAEQVTMRSWEDLMRERIFKPLEMTTAGFGPPGHKGKVDQPWGHVQTGAGQSRRFRLIMRPRWDRRAPCIARFPTGASSPRSTCLPPKASRACSRPRRSRPCRPHPGASTMPPAGG